MGDASTAHTLQRRGPWAPEERFGAKDEVPIEPDAQILTPARPMREPLVWLSPSAPVGTTREGNGRALHPTGPRVSPLARRRPAIGWAPSRLLRVGTRAV